MSTCPRCGKWNGAIAVPAGTEPTWCICGYARERRESDAHGPQEGIAYRWQQRQPMGANISLADLQILHMKHDAAISLLGRARNWVQDPVLRAEIQAVAPPAPRTEADR